MKMHRITFVIFSVPLVLLAGCVVGPDYLRPTVPSSESFRSGPETPSPESLADLPWWDIYRDESLKELIRTALVNNYDLRLAASRVEQARAFAAQVRSQFFPQFGYQGTLSTGRNEFLGAPTPKNGDNANAALLDLNVFWEIDVWGRIRRLDEAARAQYLATEEARRGVVLSLVSDVAQAYFELLELDLELDIAKRSTESFRKSFELFAGRLAEGVASKLETSRAQASLSSTAATIPFLERVITLKENQISILLGRQPAPIPRQTGLLDQYLPPEIQAGIPSTLLERRPDLRQAEQELRSANAQVGVAEADFFPQFGLTVLFGKTSPELSDFHNDTANFWSAAGNMTGPIFQGGRLTAQLQQAKAQWEQARLFYEQTTLNALREVSDALITREKLVVERDHRAEAVSALTDAVTIAMDRYFQGKSSYYEVLEAQQQLFPAENTLAQTQLNQYVVVIQLYKALGGGWKLENAGEGGEKEKLGGPQLKSLIIP
jgi:outer membrane protein, multidrug efflux system